MNQRSLSGGQTARRIAFATIGDASEVRFWSGTPFHMAKSLANEGHEVVHIGPLSAPILPLYKTYSRLCRAFRKQSLSPFHAGPVVAQYAADAARKICAVSPDFVFAPAGSNFAWAVPAGVPLVYASDATFRLVDNYHPNYRNLSRNAREIAERLERNTIARADLVLYPSEWAAESAVRDYGADRGRVHVIPWGANLEETPNRDSVLACRKPGPCRLLFIGANWEEKGADIAVGTLAELRDRGVEAELVICGCTPPKPVTQDGLTIIPYLDKNDREQRSRLDQLYRDADFFLLPTRADCYGIVFCEAAAHGVPSIAPATGGVSCAIRDEETGILLPPNATKADYATVISQTFANKDRLARLRQSSRDAFEARLNWQAWARRVSDLIQTL
ncbi:MULTISPECIES: glycosyltransferase family 4 protein [unclassified Bradyrhizobium]|uniref:glycosyltransferase family 4 protein n=1 Tax=unclassified Bradyrhizobium TaxID=2631580 RepID=UPI000364787B|nr:MULTISPECIES: glycosyltransferase family 4 protein [unclassified Bradyrhizobium]MCK1323918.1 glycosyltransferase family 4 protein [Bradyrhizobium sp. 156]MCK1351813.1 glycosyltransferase family 4 protein [Bradyrhizobium sp. CW7]MCK1418052.1 glycosyltransferase family 4 protein [Bradyrhizobium sp. CW4]MCK1495640.1 glycosyltransferase family 4 protein [Bradyrhizobium sp. 188]MCK1553460.1 glycosyltransferase family 4 protein [Bradyrhizobium sp. 177]